MREMIEKIARNKTITGAGSIILGIILIIARRSALDSLVKLLGIALLIMTGAFILMFLKSRNPANIAGAVFAGIVGLFLMLKPRSVVNFFPMAAGICLFINGLFNFSAAMSKKRMGEWHWRMPMLLSIVMMVVGVLVFLHPGNIANTLVVFIGISLIFNGISDLVLRAIF